MVLKVEKEQNFMILEELNLKENIYMGKKLKEKDMIEEVI